jgi:putative acetyltransferase
MDDTTQTEGPIVLVRPEQEPMFPAVFKVLEKAFGRPDEAQLVEKLRQTENFDPRLSLVALRDGAVVGYVLFYPVTVEMPDGTTAHAMGLGPVGVLPAHQNLGIGEALIWQGLEICRKEKEYRVIVVGHPTYYPRFGFKRASTFGVKCAYDVPDDAFMACELKSGAWDGITGIVKYHPFFDGV